MSNALVVNTPNRPVPIIIVGGGGGGGGIVAGADTQVQFNDAGAFGGDTGLTYNKTTDSVKVGGLVILGTLGDTALARSGVGVAEVNNGTVGTYRDLKVRNLQVQAGGRMTGAGAVPPAGTTGQHLMKNTGTDYDVSWTTPIYAVAQTALTTPTGTASTSGVMAGLAASITPTASGKILITVAGSMANNTVNSGGNLSIAWGTGTAPVNGAAPAGTGVGAIAQRQGSWPVGLTVPFSVSGIITGRTIGTPVWIDLYLTATGTGTFNVQQVAVTAVEIP